MDVPQPTSPVNDSRRRQEVILATERRWWRELNRAQLDLVKGMHRLDVERARWGARITSAMRGVEPAEWWRCHQRIEAGERWVGANARARWVQRVVYATRDRVQQLAAQRHARLAPLEAASTAAEARLRDAVRHLGAALRIRETARRLGLPESTVAALAGSAPLTPADHRALAGADPVSVPD